MKQTKFVLLAQKLNYIFRFDLINNLLYNILWTEFLFLAIRRERKTADYSSSFFVTTKREQRFPTTAMQDDVLFNQKRCVKQLIYKCYLLCAYDSEIVVVPITAIKTKGRRWF